MVYFAKARFAAVLALLGIFPSLGEKAPQKRVMIRLPVIPLIMCGDLYTKKEKPEPGNTSRKMKGKVKKKLGWRKIVTKYFPTYKSILLMIVKKKIRATFTIHTRAMKTLNRMLKHLS